MGTTLTTILGIPAEASRETVSQGSFDEIMRQHQKRIYRVIFLLVRDRDAADTLTQECFLRAYQSLPQFRGECRLETWLIRIAVNLVRDHVKSKRMSFWRRLIGLEDEEASQSVVPASSPSPERILLARAELESVWRAVQYLSPQQREVFLLRFVEELSLPEIAQVLGLKVGSVKAQLFRALATVRKHMKEKQWR